jgi:hypothetical protein
MRLPRRRAYPSTSAWDLEVARFKALLHKWLDFPLNRLFDLTIRGPAIRKRWAFLLGVGFIAGGLTLHIILYYIPMLAPVRPFHLSEVPLFLVLTIFRLVLILAIPAFVAITYAGNYLADIFELKDPSVAWDYISTLSLTGWDHLLHILEGKTGRGTRRPSLPATRDTYCASAMGW